MADQDNKRIVVAEIVGAHGVRGDAKIRIYAGDETLVSRKDGVFTSDRAQDAARLYITLREPYKADMWLGRIKGVTTPEAIKAMGKVRLYIARADLPSSGDDDAFYYHDLEGLAVYLDDSGQKGAEIGRILGVQNFGGGDLLSIRRKDGGKDFFHLFSKDGVPVVNIAEGYITIIEPEVM